MPARFAHDAAVPGGQARPPAMRCCCFAWATSTSCSTTTPRRPPACWAWRSPAATRARTRCRWPAFPYHQLERYLAKLIAAGHRAAVCEQVEDPKQAKGLVQREVTRIVTPGTVTDDALLDPQASNYLAAIVPPHEADDAAAGLAWVDFRPAGSTRPRFRPSSWPTNWPASSRPSCLVSDDVAAAAGAIGRPSDAITRRPAWTFGRNAAVESLAKHFGTQSLEGFGFDADGRRRGRAAGGRRGARLPGRDAEGVARAHRPAAFPTRATSGWRSTRRRAAAWRSRARCATAAARARCWACSTARSRRMGARLLADWLAAPLDRRRRDRRPARRGGRAGRRRRRSTAAARVAAADLRHRSGCWPA